ncbi:MAG TPA: phosphoribosyltransferase family protein, partial [Limnochordales bacterium]
GGVLVAREVAAALQADLRVAPVKKVALPTSPERALGAVAADGTVVLAHQLLRWLGIADHEVDQAVQEALQEARRREQRYGLPVPDLAGRVALVVDDGLATGYTCLAAARHVRRKNPATLVVAVPVAAPSSAPLVARECDQLVALLLPPDMEAVGQYYDHFGPVEDAQVLEALRSVASGPAGQGP